MEEPNHCELFLCKKPKVWAFIMWRLLALALVLRAAARRDNKLHSSFRRIENGESWRRYQLYMVVDQSGLNSRSCLISLSVMSRV